MECMTRALTEGYLSGLHNDGRHCNPYMRHTTRWWIWNVGYLEGIVKVRVD